MPLSLPVTRNITVSEKKRYELRLTFCDPEATPTASDFIIKALPLFKEALNNLGVVFLGEAAKATRTSFVRGQQLWKATSSRVGVADAGYPDPADVYVPKTYGVYTRQEPVSLFYTIAEGVLSVKIDFGLTFSRGVSKISGQMDLDDTRMWNSPALYKYYVISKTLNAIIAEGEINITIDLSDPTITPPGPPSVCNAQVT